MKAIFTSKNLNGRRILHWKRRERAESIFAMGWNVAMTHHALAANVLWTRLLISNIALKVSRLTREVTQAMVVGKGLCWGFSSIAKRMATDSLACAWNMDGALWRQPVCVFQVATTIRCLVAMYLLSSILYLSWWCGVRGILREQSVIFVVFLFSCLVCAPVLHLAPWLSGQVWSANNEPLQSLCTTFGCHLCSWPGADC